MKINVLFYSFVCVSFVFCLHVQSQSVELKLVGSGFKKPVDISSTGIQNDNRLFITEKDGTIRILLQDGTKLPTPFLDIDNKVNSQANERGLLGLTFHPDYGNNGYFFVNYTNANGHTTISRFKRNDTLPDIADPSSEKILLIVNQPFNNHNAGDLNFGPDGYLYIGLGDGGNGGDPGNRSQNPKEYLGKLLRIDVNTENENYLIPPDNPYSGNQDTLPEIWAMGLRNPWRISFDVETNEIWIADVGQDKWEEINVASVTDAALNYGWRCYEGDAPFNTNGCKDRTSFYFPVHTYENKFDIGCSITGGYVYRGSKMASVYGKYIYTDFCTGIVWALQKQAGNTWTNEVLFDGDNMDFVTFGEDNNKELFMAGLATGQIYTFVEKLTNTGEVYENAGFTLHPNPVSDELHIYLKEAAQKPTSLYISDLGGKVIGNYSVTFLPGQSEVVIDTQILQPGTYLIYSDNPQSPKLKFIKK